MNSTKIYQVKRYLFETQLTQQWLVDELNKRGVKISNSYLSKILSQKRWCSTNDMILNQSIDILAEYCSKNGTKWRL